jgi:hypothetical protein
MSSHRGVVTTTIQERRWGCVETRVALCPTIGTTQRFSGAVSQFNVPDWEGTSSPGGKDTLQVGHLGVPNLYGSGLDEERNVGSS